MQETLSLALVALSREKKKFHGQICLEKKLQVISAFEILAIAIHMLKALRNLKMKSSILFKLAFQDHFY